MWMLLIVTSKGTQGWLKYYILLYSTLYRSISIWTYLSMRVSKIWAREHSCRNIWNNTRYKKLYSTSVFKYNTVNISRMASSQWAHDVYTTSPQRWYNVMTLHRLWGDVVSHDVPAGLLLKQWENKETFAETVIFWGRLREQGNKFQNFRKLSEISGNSKRGSHPERPIQVAQQTHNVETTSIQRWFNVLTLNQRWIDVVSALCARWVSSQLYEFSGY